MMEYRHNFKAAYHYLTVSALAISAALAATTTPVHAQQARQTAAAESGVEEVIVTARKRQETLLSVPINEQAIGKTQLQALQTVSVADLAKIVPGLVVQSSLGSGGVTLNLHGLGQLATPTVSDSAVQLNLDGFSIGTGLAFQSGLFDLGQVEVLKGPQPLFYGKGSPGGVIVLHTADPTDKFEIIGVTAYEFEARTPREEFTISGPVTDTLKLRLASMYSTSEGYFNEVGVPVPNTGALAPASKRGPEEQQYIIRGTAVWNPTDQFDARLKVNLTHDRQNYSTTGEFVGCPQGNTPPAGLFPFNFIPGFQFIGAQDNCKISRDIRIVDMNPANYPGITNNGIPFQNFDQKFGTLELNYRPTQNLTLTSVTGYYFLREQLLLNGLNSTGAGSPFAVITPTSDRSDWSEEVRLNSDFNTPLNFTLGALYQSDSQSDKILTLGNSALFLPAVLQGVINDLGSTAYSVFGQLRYKITPELELAGGARWTDENKNALVTNLQTLVVVPIAVSKRVFKNAAPEVTLTYRPSEDMTMFASFKEAYLSGGFNIGPLPLVGQDISFGDEKAIGGEAGIKSRFLDHQLTVDLTGYYYHYNGLQIGESVGGPNGQVVTTVVNAAGAKSYGFDLDAAYAPEAMKGLTLNGSVAWNRARFTQLTNAPCFGGQTIALGCNENFQQSANLGIGGFTAQNLTGTVIPHAPEWQINFGFDYEMPVGSDYKLVFSNNINYSSSYLGSLFANYPNNALIQTGYAKVDLGVTLKAPDDRWEIALIGNNITDKITGCCATGDSTGSFFAPNFTGLPISGPGGKDDAIAYASVGREIWLRVTLRPFN